MDLTFDMLLCCIIHMSFAQTRISERYSLVFKLNDLSSDLNDLSAPPTAQGVLRPDQKQAHSLYFSQFRVNTRKMSVAYSQPDNKALKDKK